MIPPPAPWGPPAPAVRLGASLAILLQLGGCAGEPVLTHPTGDDTSAPTDSGIVPLAGSLSAAVNPDLVTEVAVVGALAGPALLQLTCTATVDSQLEERHVVVADAVSAEPALLLRGLLPETDYACAAVDTRTPAGESLTLEFTTGVVPDALQAAVIEQVNWDLSLAVTGYFLMDLGRFVDSSTHDHFVVVLDMMGRVRWYYSVDGADGTLSAEYVPERSAFLIGAEPGIHRNPILVDLSGDILARVDTIGHHDATWFDDSVFNVTGAGDGEWSIERHDVDAGSMIWSFLATEVPSLTSHGLNAVKVVDEDHGRMVYASLQLDDHIMKVAYETHEFLWSVGEKGDFELIGDERWFDLTHDMHPVDCDHDTCLLFYDNGHARGHSRVSLLGLDETAMTAEYVRTWSEEGWSEPIYGSIQELPGGAWLLGRGHLEQMAPDSADTTVVQVLADDSTPWRLVITPSEWTLYRARWIDGGTLFANVGYGYIPSR